MVSNDNFMDHAVEDQRIFNIDDYRIDIIVHGFPGKSVCHGPLGFSTIALIRYQNRAALVDVGGFGQRLILNSRLRELGVSPEEITDVLLTHSHFDHAINWVAFPNARVFLSVAELDWAKKQEPGRTYVPELYIDALSTYESLTLVEDEDIVFPGIKALICPGHTPGSTVFVLETKNYNVVFTGDACKNRAELMSKAADMTYDKSATKSSINRIWEEWTRHSNGILIPGHDLPLHIEQGKIHYVGEREASIKAWYNDSLEKTTVISLLPKS